MSGGGTSALARAVADWQPELVEVSRRVDPWPSAAFAALLDVADPTPGGQLPPLWHWFTLLDHPAQSALGDDGHPTEGAFLPPIPDRRRMWAGGRFEQRAPIEYGANLSSRARVSEVAVKSGRSGELAFVTVRSELTVDGRQVAVEEQDIVYRSGDPGRTSNRPAADEPAGDWTLEVATDPVLLARFSALTYNGHRIHYDRPYATEVEGYPDLVVHGPLMALLALELPRRNAPDRRVGRFSYRILRPMFVPTRIVAVGIPSENRVEVAVGTGPSLTATVELETG
ncbi:FAS1-like dehydratase domain-containing protein [Cryptosporangium minutisporangium]|uniref:MaoC family dehydratase N-terminal domain-containing protein n=1 Tax=Cryptosporangium minutisporangium TaxID=113569 RepID=A0ABP6T0M7_9ACTN